MPDIQLIKLSIRRGTDEQRQKVVLEQGEIGYTTDHKRLWVGDGILSGGNIIGAKIHSPLAAAGARTSLDVAKTGDAVYEANLFYQLTGSDYSDSNDWGSIYTKPDLIYLQYNGTNQLTIVDNSITGDKFAPSAAFNAGGLVATTSNGLSVVPDNTTIEVANSAVQVKDDGINENKIISSALYNGLSGGSGEPLQLSVNLNHFGYVGTVLQLSALPSNIVTFESINSNAIGDGLNYDAGSGTIQANISGVDATLENNSGVVGLKTIVASDTISWAEVTKDVYGRVTETKPTPVTALTSTSTAGALSVFAGYPGQVTDGYNTGLTQAVFDCLSGPNTVSLSSAGFITIAGIEAQDGKTIDRVAIPVFTF